MDILGEQGFKSLSVEDRELFTLYYEQMNDNWASSISFPSMIAWNKSIRIYHRKIGEYLCCLAMDSTCNRWVVLPLIGHYEQEKVDACINELKDIMGILKLPIIFTDVSEWMLPFYLNSSAIKLKASYDRGLSDYIYTKEEFFQGLDRQYCRYDYNYFIRKNNPRLVIMGKEDVNQYLDFLARIWCTAHDCNYCQYGCLKDSATGIISNLEEAGARGIVVYVGDEIYGYTIVSLDRDQLIFHFKKGIHRVRGLSEYMHRSCCELFGEKAKYINYTEDMNLEGLRVYKQRLAQYELYPKYELCVG